MSKRRDRVRAEAFLSALGFIVLIGIALMPRGVGAADPSTAPTQTGSPQAAFQSNQDGDAHRIAVAAAFLFVLGISAFATVRYGRKQIPLTLRAVDVKGGIRLLSARRVTPRLTIVKLLLDDRKTVVIADNGQHLLLVAELTNPTPSDEKHNG